jgi:hypothetical protein
MRFIDFLDCKFSKIKYVLKPWVPVLILFGGLRNNAPLYFALSKHKLKNSKKYLLQYDKQNIILSDKNISLIQKEQQGNFLYKNHKKNIPPPIAIPLLWSLIAVVL